MSDTTEGRGLHVPKENADFWGDFPGPWEVISEALDRLLRCAERNPKGDDDAQLARDASHILEGMQRSYLSRLISPGLEAAIVAVIDISLTAAEADPLSPLDAATLNLALEWTSRNLPIDPDTEPEGGGR